MKKVLRYQKVFYICVVNMTQRKKKTKKMTTTQITKRELHFQLSEIENTLDAFKFAVNLMTALKNKIVSHEEYDMFSGDLYWKCLNRNIKTTNECISLF